MLCPRDTAPAVSLGSEALCAATLRPLAAILNPTAKIPSPWPSISHNRYRFAEPGLPHFLTCTIVEWLPIFTRPEAAQILFDAWPNQQAQDCLRLYVASWYWRTIFTP